MGWSARRWIGGARLHGEGARGFRAHTVSPLIKSGILRREAGVVPRSSVPSKFGTNFDI